MKKILFIMLLIFTINSMVAQDFTAILQKIEENNTTLMALRSQMETEKVESRVGLTPDNPEVEFGYLWGTPTSIGNRTDFSVTQTFEFPTVYYYQHKIASGMATQAELDYSIRRKSLLLDARKCCINLVYCNAMNVELQKRTQIAEDIAQAYQKKMDNGDCTVLELNKARLNELSARKAYETNQIERNLLIAELSGFNGGKVIDLTASAYDSILLPEDFAVWYGTVESYNPELKSIHLQQEINRLKIQLSRSEWGPQLSAGYKSEHIAGTTLQGLSVGIAIPLWQNKNTVKMAKAQMSTLHFRKADAQLQYYHSLKAYYDQAVSLQQLSNDFRHVLNDVNSIDLLRTAFEKGQLTLIEYMMEQTLYYESVDQVLLAERDFQIAVAELMRWSEF